MSNFKRTILLRLLNLVWLWYLYNRSEPWPVLKDEIDNNDNDHHHTDFDFEYCAELHNELVRRGVEGSGDSLDVDEFPSFWDDVSEYHDQLIQRVSPSVVEFMKRAIVVPNTGLYNLNSNYQHLFYFISGLVNPVLSWIEESLHYWDDENMYRYLHLYVATNIQSHSVGIVFDQKDNKAIMLMFLFSATVGHSEIQWQPLEVILEQYHDMIDVGVVSAAARHEMEWYRSKYSTDGYAPWRLHSYSKQTLARSVSAYNRLTKAIETRMPAETMPDRKEERKKPALLTSQEELCFPQDGFLRNFIRQTRNTHSRLKYIAPGILTFGPSLFTQQKLCIEAIQNKYLHQLQHSSNMIEQNQMLPPTLLFPVEAPNVFFTTDPTADDEQTPFSWPFSTLTTGYQPGLWILESNPWFPSEIETVFEDTAVLILPFTIGQVQEQNQDQNQNQNQNQTTNMPSPKKYLQTNDGFNISQRSRTSLYQTRYNPFISTHFVQLYLILENWAERVERGDWTVDENGVVGAVSVSVSVSGGGEGGGGGAGGDGIETFRTIAGSGNGREEIDKFRVPLMW